MKEAISPENRRPEVRPIGELVYASPEKIKALEQVLAEGLYEDLMKENPAKAEALVRRRVELRVDPMAVALDGSRFPTREGAEELAAFLTAGMLQDEQFAGASMKWVAHQSTDDGAESQGLFIVGLVAPQNQFSPEFTGFYQPEDFPHKAYAYYAATANRLIDRKTQYRLPLPPFAGMVL